MSEPSEILTFLFNGKPVTASAGDTIASALYRSGQRIFSRSFKYHRPRGLLCLTGKCPNCLMNVDGTPNVRTCTTRIVAGMRVTHQNAYPSLENDFLSVVQRFDWLMPVGWYYKTMTNPRVWHAAEPFVRRVAGLGVAPSLDSVTGNYEHSYRHTEVAIVGGGPAGITSAIELATQGEQVTLIDDQPALGGHLRYSKSPDTSPADLVARVRALPNIRVLQGCYCFGLYEGNLLGVVRPRKDPKDAERLIHLRAGRVVVATGAYESPLLFPNNDLVGIMLSTAVQRLIRLHGIAPGKVAVVIGRSPREEPVVADLREAGIQVAATVAPESVVKALGSQCVTGVANTRRTICLRFSGHVRPSHSRRRFAESSRSAVALGREEGRLYCHRSSRQHQRGGRGDGRIARRRSDAASGARPCEQARVRLPVLGREFPGPGECDRRRLRPY